MMMRNLLLLSLLIAAVHGATIDTKAVKPTRKSTHEIRKVMKSALHDAPKKTTAAAAAAAAAKIRSGELKPNVDAHSAAADNKQAVGAAVAAPLSLRGAAKVEAQEVRIHNKAKLFSPNKGFVEIADYGTDWNCYDAPKSISGSAVNFCYFDPETGSAAEVATLTKMPNNGKYFTYQEFVSSTSLVYDDPHCTTLNVSATSVNGPYPRNTCYYEMNANNSFTGRNIKMDHVFTPTFLQNDATVMFLEYVNEGGCANNDPNALVSYGSLDIASFACEAYVNVDEYFKLSCDAGVVKAQIYSDPACATLAIRAEDVSNGCNDLDVAYPFRMTCGSPP